MEQFFQFHVLQDWSDMILASAISIALFITVYVLVDLVYYFSRR